MTNRDYGCDSHRRADTEDACAARQTASRCLQGPSARAASQDIARAEACRLEHESESAWPGPQDLPSLIEAQAERTPLRRAVRCGEDSLTYRALDRRANGLARYLQRFGIGPNVMVGLLVERSLDMVVAMVAIQKAGATCVPLDPSSPQERLESIMDDSEMTTVITETTLASLIARPAQVILMDLEWRGLPESVEAPQRSLKPQDLCYVHFTSGSTGRPKGVPITHASLVNFLHGMALVSGMSEQDVILSLANIAFDPAIVEIYMPLTLGACSVIVPRCVTMDGLALKALLEQLKPTILSATPYTFKMLLEAQWTGHAPLKIYCGGETMSTALAGALLARCTSLWNVYGPTEATVLCAVHEVTAAKSKIPIGLPMPNVSLFILNEQGKTVPAGVAGELYIGGLGLSPGYLKRPEMTRERFVTLPIEELGLCRLYRSGDRARYRSDGTLEILGRIDHQLKIRGCRVEPGEIEAVFNRYSAVRECLVVLREDAPGIPRLVAYVACVQGSSVNVAELRRFASQRLAPYMMPSVIVLVESLPLNVNGKIDRAGMAGELGARLLALRTTSSNPGGSAHLTGQTNLDVTEARLKVVWDGVLGCDCGLDDDFFEQGGRSLLAVRLLSQIRREFRVELPFTVLLAAPTVKLLAARINGQAAPNCGSSLVPIRQGGDRAPVFCFHTFGGHVLGYQALASLLRSDRLIYGLRAQGLDGVTPPHATIEEMAAHYVLEIERVQPDGPFLLLGYSSGGTVAYEVAQQLLERGGRVGLLALIDTESTQHLARRPSFATRLSNLSRNKDKVTHVAASLRWKLYLLRRMMPVSLTDSSHRLERAAIQALNRYITKPYAGRITLIQCEERPAYYPDPTLGWGTLAGAGLDIYEVPGNHISMMQQPHVRDLAERVQRVLDDTDHPSSPRKPEAS